MLELKSGEPARVEYEQDLVLWYQHQIALLRERRFDELDVENLIEELRGAMSKERRELASRLKVLLMHLLKCQFQHSRISGSWLGTLTTQRDEIEKLLESSPSLRPSLMQVAEKAYPIAVRLAVHETGLPESVFPVSNPYSAGQLLDLDFVP
ncbi:MAG: DUF29 domain-containing protein [Telluria sp.]